MMRKNGLYLPHYENEWQVDNDIANMCRNTAANHTEASISFSWMRWRLEGKILRVSFKVHFNAAFGSAGTPIFVKLPSHNGVQLVYDTTYYTNGAATTFREAPVLGKGDYFDGSGGVAISWYPDLGAVAGNCHVRAANAGGSSYADNTVAANRALIACDLEIPVTY